MGHARQGVAPSQEAVEILPPRLRLAVAISQQQTPRSLGPIGVRSVAPALRAENEGVNLAIAAVQNFRLLNVVSSELPRVRDILNRKRLPSPSYATREPASDFAASRSRLLNVLRAAGGNRETRDSLEDHLAHPFVPNVISHLRMAK